MGFKRDFNNAKIRIFMKENKDKTNIWLDIEKSAKILGLVISDLCKFDTNPATLLYSYTKKPHTRYFLHLVRGC